MTPDTAEVGSAFGGGEVSKLKETKEQIDGGEISVLQKFIETGTTF